MSEEYARAEAPARVSHIGEDLLAPTLIAFGTPEQQERFLPAILRGDELWCQGYSEPNAGSDLANVATTAVLDGDEWVINGQKVWTSLAHVGALVLRARAHRAGVATRHKGLSYLLVPMDQPGVEIRPIVQITGGAEFNEVFFDGARTERRPRRRRGRRRAGGSRWACSASSAACRRSASSSASSASSTHVRRPRARARRGSTTR